MQFIGALIREQGQVFEVISVQPHVLDNPTEANRLIETASSIIFPGYPVAAPRYLVWVHDLALS